MVDWYESRTNTYEYYLVDPNTWTDRRRLENITAGSITRDLNAETLGSASLEMNDEDLGEFYVRIYLVTIQNGMRERHPLGVFLVQTSSYKFDGKIMKPSLTAYSPLLEMRDVKPPLGYACKKRESVLSIVKTLFDDYCRAPVVPVATVNDILELDFVAEPSDTWLSFIRDLLAKVKYHIELDEMGKIIFAPDQIPESMSPVFTYNDNNSSILYPEITKSIDIFGVPNTLEVVYSGDDVYRTAIAVNEDENSIVSTVNRGRVVYERVENPETLVVPTQGELDAYAEELLKKKSEIECQLTYQHGFNDVRIGDCVRVNYLRAGLNDIKGQVIQQKITCDTECRVDETIVFKKKLWG